MRSDPIRVDAALPVALCVCAALAWIAGVLLLTRQSGWLLLLMAGTVPGGIPLARYARKRGRHGLLAATLAGLGLALTLGLLALADTLEPDAPSSAGRGLPHNLHCYDIPKETP